MFGGLDLKGKPSDKKESSSDGLAAPASCSAFSFLNSTSSEPTSLPVPSAPQSSAFSFLSSPEKSVPDPAPTEIESAPAVSAFSFLSPSPTKEPNEVSEPVAAPSSFSFLQSSSSQDAANTAAKSNEGSSLSSPSTLSFMGSADAGLATSVPVPVNVELSGSANNIGQNALAGAGVAFGKATVAPVIKKKRTTRARTAKVGVAANLAELDESQSHASIPDVIPVPVPAPVDHAAAIEASRKAEHFIHSKMVQQVTVSDSPGGSPRSESYSNSIGASNAQLIQAGA